MYSIWRGLSIIFCDNGNEVKFMDDKCLGTNCTTRKVVMSTTRIKNMYVDDLESIEGDDLSCLSSQIDYVDIWQYFYVM